MTALRRYASLLLLLLLAATAAHGAAPSTGDPALGFSGQGPNGMVVKFDPARLERPALILFWATWCPYCRALMPSLQAVRQRVGREHLDVYAVDVFEDEGADPAGELRDRGLDFTLVVDGDSIATAYGVRGLPTLYLIGIDGRVKYTRPNGATPAAVEEALLALLAQGKPQ